MIVKRIEYSKRFKKAVRKLTPDLQQQVIKAESLFKDNPLHPSLRLHQLHGKLKKFWSISVNLDLRIIFSRTDEGVIIFFLVGNHDIYEK